MTIKNSASRLTVFARKIVLFFKPEASQKMVTNPEWLLMHQLLDGLSTDSDAYWKVLARLATVPEKIPYGRLNQKNNQQ